MIYKFVVITTSPTDLKKFLERLPKKWKVVAQRKTEHPGSPPEYSASLVIETPAELEAGWTAARELIRFRNRIGLNEYKCQIVGPAAVI